MVPEGWKKTTFGEHIELLTGHPFKSEFYTDNSDGIKLLRGDNIVQGGLRWDGVKRWPSNNTTQLDKFALHEGDVVLAMDRTWVKAGLKCAKVKLDDTPALLVQRVARIRGTNSLLSTYLYYLLQAHRFTQYVKGVQTETAVPHISAKQIREYGIALPPLSEQKAIAGILSTWDRAIELTEQLIAAKQQRKQALIHAIFSQKVRLKDPNGNSYPDWKLQRLGELYNISSSKRVFQSEWKSSGIPFYRAREIIKLSKEGCVDNQLYISKKMYHEYANKYGAPKIGDILITGVGTIGVLYHVQNNSPFYFKDGNIIWLRSRSSIISRYLKHVFDSRMVKKQILESASITTVATYTIDSAKKTKIPVPHHDEQKRIAEILDQQDSEIEKLKQKRSLQQAQKKGLMQQLLTGKVRVKGGAD